MEARAVPENDRRAEHRQRALLACRVIYGDTHIAIEGAVRDISAHGAKVRLKSPVPLPGHVRLMLIKEGALYDADVVSRRESEIGLHFTGRTTMDDVADETVRELRRLWLSLAGFGSDATGTTSADDNF